MSRRALQPEAAVQKAVLDLLAAERVYALRLNTGAFRNTQGRPIFLHSGGKGVADIVAFPVATIAVQSIDFVRPEMRRVPLVLWIECKAPEGRQTAEQREFENNMTGRGMHYLVARGAEDVLTWLKEHR